MKDEKYPLDKDETSRKQLRKLRMEEEENLKDYSDIEQIKDMIKLIVGEMDALHTKTKLLEIEFQDSKDKIREKIN